VSTCDNEGFESEGCGASMLFKYAVQVPVLLLRPASLGVELVAKSTITMTIPVYGERGDSECAGT
jgi:hypothetical protein